jgi:hypothetical protein
MGDALVVSESYPASWQQLAELPLLASEPWHRATSGRLEGTPVWLSFEDGTARRHGPGVGLAGYVVTDPDAYRYGNVAALVADGELASAAADLGYRGLPLTSESTLEVPPGGFDDYLTGLPPRRRRKVLADRRAAARHGLTGGHRSTVDANLRERIVELRLLHRLRYRLPADPEAERCGWTGCSTCSVTG